MDLSQVGESVEGNPLYKAVVGSGPKTLMIATQQHGDEPLGTEAALYLLDYLAGDSAEAEALREEVTVVVMPRVNPDGFARWEQQVAGRKMCSTRDVTRMTSISIVLMTPNEERKKP